jgi:hypothetical protein
MQTVLARHEGDEAFPLDALLVDPSAGTISGTTSHFSHYALYYVGKDGRTRVKIASEIVCSSACPVGYYRMWQRRSAHCEGGVETHCVLADEDARASYYACGGCTPCYRSLRSAPSITCLDGDAQHLCVRDVSTCATARPATATTDAATPCR